MTRLLAPGRVVRQVTRHPVLQERDQPRPLGGRALRAPLGMPPLLKPVCLAVLLAAAPAGWALPQGAIAVSGQVALRSPQPSTLEILQTSAKAGLDWRSFSIAAGERVLIRQPDAASVLFNRVLGADPSLIFGQLQANGRVFLSNPRGIIFGAGSQVDVGSLVATTLAVNNTALANGNYQLSGATAETGELRADGEIRAPGGTVALVSPRLSVGGNLLAGRVGLAAVGAVQLDVDGDGLIFFNARNDQLDARLSLLPSAELRGGSAELRAVARSGFADTVLNLEGVVRARGLGLRGGRIVLDGGAHGITRVAGTLDASGNAEGERGGDIVVLGQKVGLTSTSLLDSSGSAAGGSILVGGDFQGKNPDLRNAERVTVLGGARLVADATGQGDGGRVVVWSDKATRFKGEISARGAARGGDGGNVEVSGKDYLDFSGAVDLAAPRGRAGTLLLDPTNIEIVALAANANINADGTLADDIDNTGGAGGTPTLAFAAAGTNSKISAPGLVTQLGRGAVELQASTDILVSAGVSSVAGNLLTLRAGRNISVLADLSVSGGIRLSAKDPGDTATPAGHVMLTANLDAGTTGTLTITNNGGATAHSLGGNLTGGTIAITGDVALTQSAIWTVNTAGPSTVAGQISGVGFGLTKAGTGNLTLSGTSSYTGNTTISGGTLKLSGAAASVGGMIAVGANTLDLSDGAIVANALTIGAGGTLANSSLTGTLAANVGSPLSAASAGTLNLASTGGGLTIARVIDDSAAVTALSVTGGGAGGVTLSGANSYSGATTVNAGRLLLGANGTLPSGNAVTVNGATAVLDIAGFNNTVASVTLQGAGTISGTSGVLTSTAAFELQNGSVGAILGGTAGLNKTGAGTVTLSGANTYTGKTSILDGALSVASLGSVTAPVPGTSSNLGLPADAASGTIDLGSATGTGTLVYTGTGETTDRVLNLAGTTGGGTVVQSGIGLLKFSSALTATGVGSKMLTLQGLGGGTAELAGAVVDNSGANTTALTKAGSVTWTLSGANSYTGGTSISAGSLQIGAGGTTGSITGDVANAGALVFNRSDAVSFGGVISGAGSLTQAGSGTLTLSGANTYTGKTSILDGALSVASLGSVTAPVPGTSSNLGLPADAASGMIDLGSATSTGTLVYTGTGETTDRVLNLAGTTGGGTVVQSGIGLLKFSSALTATGAGSKTLTLQGLGGGTAELAGAVVDNSGANTTALTKAGSVTWTLSGASSYTGATTVSAGSLTLGAAERLADTSTLVVSGGSFNLGGFTETVAGVQQTGGTISNGTLISSAAFDLQAGAASAVLAGAVGLNKTGPGTLTLSGPNTYTGKTSIQDGVLSVASIGSVGAGSSSLGSPTTPGNGTIDLGSGATSGTLLYIGSAQTTDRVINLAGTTGGGTIDQSGAGLLKFSSALTATGAGSKTLTLQGSSAGTGELAGAVVDNGGANNTALSKAGSGTWTLSGANSYSGATTVGAGGTLKLGAADVIPDGAGKGDLTVTATGTLDLNTFAETINGLAGGGTVDTVAGGTPTLTVGANATTSSFTGVLQNSAGALALSKVGTGMLTLSNNNTYVGKTSIQGGALLVASISSVGGGSSGLGAPATVANGTINLGSGAGTGTLVYTGGAQTTDRVINLEGTTGGGTLDQSGSGLLKFSSALTATGVGSKTLTLQGSSAGTGELAGAVVDNGGANITALSKAGSGTWTVSGTNSYSADTTVGAGGTLRLGAAGVIPDGAGKGGVTVTGTLDLNTFSEAINGLSGTGVVDTVAGAGTPMLTVGGNAATSIFSGAIKNTTGALALTKTGSGTLTLSGANTYSGKTSILDGALSVASLGSVAAPVPGASSNLGKPVDVASGTIDLGSTTTTGTLVYSGTGETTDRVINLAGTTGGGTIDQSGSGLLKFSSALTASGAGSKTLTLQGSSGGTGELAGAVLDNSGVNTTALSKTGSGSWTLSGANSYSGPTTVGTGGTLATGAAERLPDASTVTVAAGGTFALGGPERIGTLVGAGTVNLGVHTLTLGDNALADKTFSGTINGDGGLTKQGSGRLILSGNNGYKGATLVNEGVLQAASSGALGTADAGTTVTSGAALELIGGITLADVLSLSGSGAGVSNTGALRSLSGANTLTGAVTLGSAARINSDANTLTLSASAGVGGAGRDLRVGGVGDTVLAGVVATGSGALVKDGSGALTLGAANSYTGGTSVSAGVLATSQAQRIAAGTALTVAAGASLLLTGDQTLATLDLQGSLGGTGTLTASSSAALAGASVNTGLSTVVLSSTGATVISAAAAASGSATVNGGSLTLAAGGSLSTPSLILSAGTLHTSVNEQIVDSAAVSVAAGATLALGGAERIGTLAGSGTVSLGVHTLTVGDNGLADQTFNGAINGDGGLTKLGSGRLILSGVNGYKGATLVNEGVLQAASSAALGTVDAGTTVSAGAALELSGGVMLAESLALSGTGLNNTGALRNLGGSNTLTGPVSLAGAVRLNSDAGLLSLTAGSTLSGAGSSLSVGGAGNTMLAGAINTGSGALVKDGGGTLSLSAANSYTGGTTVAAGLLATSQAQRLAAGTALTIGTGASMLLTGDQTLATLDLQGTLGGTGNLTAGSSATLAGGTLNTGLSTVVLSSNGATTINAAANASGSATVNSGSLTLGVGGSLSAPAITVAAGSLLTQAAQQLNAGVAMVVAAGASLSLGADQTVDSLNLSGALGGIGVLTASGSATLAGAAVATGLHTAQLSSSGSSTITAAVTASATATVTGGSLTLGAGGSLTTPSLVVLAGTLATTNLLQLTGSTAVNLAAGGSLTLGADAAVDALTGTGTVALGAATLTLGSNGSSSTFGGALVGAGGLVKQGAGSLTLTGANAAHAGSTTVAAGTLVLDGAAAGTGSGLIDVGASRLQIDNGASLANAVTVSTGVIANTSGSGTLAAAGSLSLQGSARLQVSGAGLTVAAAISEAGGAQGLDISGGLVTLSGTNAFSGPVRLRSGSLVLQGGAALADNVALTLDNSPGTLLQLQANETLGSLAGGGASGGDLALGSHSLSLGGNDTSTDFSGVISGSGGLQKLGTGTLTLSGANSLTGTTRISAGTLRLSNPAVLLASAVTLDNSPGVTLALAASANIGSLAGGGAAGGQVELGGSLLSLGADNSDTRFGGVIGGSGGLIKQGTGTWTLDGGGNSFGGGTLVTAGVLAIDRDSRLGAAASPLTLDGGGLQANADLTLAASRALAVGAAGGSLDTQGHTVALNAILSGAGNLQKLGAGSLVLNQANSLTGATQVSAGTLRLNHAAVLPASTVTLDNSPGVTLALAADARIGSLAGGGAAGGRVELGGFTLSTGADGRSTVFAGELNGAGGLLKEGSGSFTLSGNNHFTGDTTLAGGALLLLGGAALPSGGTLTLADVAALQLELQGDQTIGALAGGGPSGGNLVLGSHRLSTGGNGRSTRFAGVVSGSGGLVKQGAGNFTLAGTNTFSGPVAVQAGTLTLQGGAALTDGVSLSLANAAGVGLVLLGDETLGSLAGGGAAGGEVQLGGQRLTIGGNGASTRFDGVISGAGSLAKLGSGRLTLTGTNTYAGGTQLRGGELAVAADAQLGSLPPGAAAGPLLFDGGSLVATDSFVLAAQRDLVLQGAGAGLSVDAGKTLQIPGRIVDGSSAGSLSKTGGGRLLLSNPADNGYTGATQVLGGVLGISRDGQLGRAPDGLAAQQLVLDGGSLLVQQDMRLAATRGLLLGSAGGVIDVEAGHSLQLGGPVSSVPPGLAALPPGSLAGSLSKLGAGRLSLDGAADNAYAGATRVLGGVLAIQRDGQLGVSPASARAGHLLLAGGALQAEASTVLDARRGLALGAAGGEIGVAAGQTLAYAGLIADADALGPAGALHKTGDGLLDLAGSQTSSYRGATLVSGGVLAISADRQLGSVPGVATPGQLLLDGGSLQASASLRLASQRGLLLGSAGGTLTVADGQTLAYAGTLGDLAPAGVAAPAGRLVKAGAGRFTLDNPGNNSFAGGSTLLAGELAVARDGQLGAVPALATPDQLRLDGGSLLFTQSGVLASTRGIGLGAAGGTLAVAAGAQVAYGGVLADAAALPGAGVGSFSKDGTGQLSLSGDSTYTGTTRVLAGTLATVGDQRLPSAGSLQIANAARFQLGGDLSLVAVGDLAGSAVDGTARLDIGSHSLTVSTPADLTGAAFDGVLMSAGGQLVKRGEGTLQLGGSTSGASLLRVEQGTLLSVGPAALSADTQVQVAAAATLRLSDAATVGAITLRGSLAGPGRLSSGGVTLDGGRVDSPVAAGVLSSQGSSLIKAPVSVSGATTLEAGSLTLGAAGTLQAGRITLHDGATLATLASGQLLPGALLQADSGSRLQLAGSESVDWLSLAGTLGGPGVLDVIGTAALSGARVDTRLHSAVLSSQGSSQINAPVLARQQASLSSGTLTLGAAGSLATPQLTLQAGELITSAAQALASGTALVVAAPATLRLGADASVRSLQLAGTLTRTDGPAAAGAADIRLTATESVQLDGGQVRSALRTPRLSSQGNSLLAAPVLADTSATLQSGTLTVSPAGLLSSPLLQVQAGRLVTQGAQGLDPTTVLQMAAGSALSLGGDQSLAALTDLALPAGLAGAASPAQLSLAEHSLSVGSAGSDVVFGGQLLGSGSLVKQGAGAWLLSADQFYGATRIEAGTLQIGIGGTAGSLGSGAVLNLGALRFARSDNITLANPVSGSGMLEQAGTGNLTLSVPGNAWSGITQVSRGALLTDGANRLPDQSSVRVAAGARLVLGGDETVHDISADGPVSLAGSVSTAGDQRYRGPVTLVSPAAAPLLFTLTAPGHTIEALHDDNQWGAQPLSLLAGQVLLSAGRTPAAGGGAASYRDLVLGLVTLSGLATAPAGAAGPAAAPAADPTASVIEGGRLQLGASVAAGQAGAGDARRDGLLQQDGGALTLRAHAPASYAILPLVPGESAAVDPAKGRQIWVANDVILQSANSQVLTRSGAGLLLQSPAGGSINLSLLGNRFEGSVSALSGANWNTAWAGVDLPGGRETGQSRISLGGQVLRIGGQGLEADLIRLSAARLGTDAESRVVARLWYNDAGSGVSNSTPGLQITLLNEAFGQALPAGSPGGPLNVSIGDRSLGAGREGLSAGYVQILPKQHGAGSTAVFLSGPKVGVLGYSFFHDGAGDQFEVPVYYNGVLPATPQLSGSLSAVASVSESARRERFEEAVRTENVAIRLRAGVIAEVGPGRSATQGSQGLKLPASCTGAVAVLGCEASP